MSEPIPHSWGLDNWPEWVYPNSPEKARYLVREQRAALVKAKALVRIGRNLVILGKQYEQWLQKQGDKVVGFEIAANRKADK